MHVLTYDLIYLSNLTKANIAFIIRIIIYHNKEANFCSITSPKSKARENIIMCDACVSVPVFTLAHTIDNGCDKNN